MKPIGGLQVSFSKCFCAGSHTVSRALCLSLSLLCDSCRNYRVCEATHNLLSVCVRACESSYGGRCDEMMCDANTVQRRATSNPFATTLETQDRHVAPDEDAWHRAGTSSAPRGRRADLGPGGGAQTHTAHETTTRGDGRRVTQSDGRPNTPHRRRTRHMSKQTGELVSK